MGGLADSERRREFYRRVERKIDHLHGQYGIDAVVHHDYVPPTGRGYADIAWLARRPLALLADGRDVPVAAFRFVADAEEDAINHAIQDLDTLRPAVAWLILPDDVAAAPGWDGVPGHTVADVVRSRLRDEPARILVRTERDLDRILGGSRE